MVDTGYMITNAKSETERSALNLQNMLRGQPVDHPVNRLGEIIESHAGIGEIRRATLATKMVVYFGWSVADNRAWNCDSLQQARRIIGAPLPKVGMDEEGFGSNRLGKCVEKLAGGEIWKHNTVVSSYYYAWPTGAEEAIECWSLANAREQLGHVIEHKSAKTPPKSANEQNRKGYKAK